MKEIKVREYGWWTSYTYMKYMKPLTIALSGMGGDKEEMVGVI
jgi:hypothetical protein